MEPDLLEAVTKALEDYFGVDVKITDIQILSEAVRLNFLAPKLKEAILLGHQPRHMKLADLMQNIPGLWHEQGELFGCEVV